MPIHVTQSDVKTNIVILDQFSKQFTGPLASAATRLVAIFQTQLNETSRRELADAGLDLDAYARDFIV